VVNGYTRVCGLPAEREQSDPAEVNETETAGTHGNHHQESSEGEREYHPGDGYLAAIDAN